MSIKLRKPLKIFARQMELMLREHDGEWGESGWEELSLDFLRQRAARQFNQLQIASAHGEQATICRKAIHVANFCMMIVDNIKKRHGASADPEKDK